MYDVINYKQHFRQEGGQFTWIVMQQNIEFGSILIKDERMTTMIITLISPPMYMLSNP